jgi:hypothetical protein
MTNHKTITLDPQFLEIQDHESGITSNWKRQPDELDAQWEQRQYALVMEYIEPAQLIEPESPGWLPTNEELDEIEAIPDFPPSWDMDEPPTHWDGPDNGLWQAFQAAPSYENDVKTSVTN